MAGAMASEPGRPVITGLSNAGADWFTLPLGDAVTIDAGGGAVGQRKSFRPGMNRAGGKTRASATRQDQVSRDDHR